jgi:nucleotide-binding universal stress UspA family protein
MTSTPLRTILVGVDDSPGAARALAWAAGRAREAGASILAVHVLTYSTQFRRDLSLDTITTWRRNVEHALRDQWTGPARDHGVAITCEVVEDDTVAAGILAAAARDNVDLVVLGAHGHGDLADRLLGATTYRVSHAARTPVVIVPVDWHPAAA